MSNKLIFYVVIALMVFSRVVLLTLTDGTLLAEQFELTNIYSVVSDILILLGLYLSAYKRNLPHIFALLIIVNTGMFALFTAYDLQSTPMTASGNVALWLTGLVYYFIILKSLLSLVRKDLLTR